MAACKQLLKETFPTIDEELCSYIEDVLEEGGDSFSTVGEIHEVLGEYLQPFAGEDEDKNNCVLEICEKLLTQLKTNMSNGSRNEEFKKLSTPINIKEVEEKFENDNCEAVIPQKIPTNQKVVKNERTKQSKKRQIHKPKCIGSNEGATVCQTSSRRFNRMDASGVKITDIKLENFDIAFGDKLLIKNANLTLVAGRRYGLVGRNGLGKTTFLRMLASNQLKIPSHISILHVEQEVVGDETTALQSVLECDTLRESLLKEEADITNVLNSCEDSSLRTRLNEIYLQLETIEADKAPSKASVILSGLGFNPSMQQQQTKLFSGGWRMRLALARALFSVPDLLLLDEPTNMLDMKAVFWLESYLQNWPTTLLLVSHDRQFLNIVPTDILHLHSQRIDSYRGNYDNFVKAMTEKHKHQQREYDAQQQHRAHVQKFIDKYRQKNAKVASVVQSKIKLLEKLPELLPVEKEKKVIFKFPKVDKLSPPIIQLDGITFHYVDGKTIFKNVSASANMESRICIVGDNGTGKSTLLKIILGDLSPVSGIRHVHRHLRIGYFSQHHVDQLDMDMSSVELFALKFPGRPSEEYRHQLGSFGISGNLALQQISTLSGGQKSRVAFSIMSMSRPNFLILDEPTNHLDVETIEALANALKKFNGGLILVAHDERLIRSVCNELWICHDKGLEVLEGGFDRYRAIVQAQLLVK